MEPPAAAQNRCPSPPLALTVPVIGSALGALGALMVTRMGRKGHTRARLGLQQARPTPFPAPFGAIPSPMPVTFSPVSQAPPPPPPPPPPSPPALASLPCLLCDPAGPLMASADRLPVGDDEPSQEQRDRWASGTRCWKGHAVVSCAAVALRWPACGDPCVPESQAKGTADIWAKTPDAGRPLPPLHGLPGWLRNQPPASAHLSHSLLTGTQNGVSGPRMWPSGVEADAGKVKWLHGHIAVLPFGDQNPGHALHDAMLGLFKWLFDRIDARKATGKIEPGHVVLPRDSQDPSRLRWYRGLFNAAGALMEQAGVQTYGPPPSTERMLIPDGAFFIAPFQKRRPKEAGLYRRVKEAVHRAAGLSADSGPRCCEPLRGLFYGREDTARRRLSDADSHYALAADVFREGGVRHTVRAAQLGSVDNQITAFARADVAFMVGGGADANMLWLPPDAVVALTDPCVKGPAPYNGGWAWGLGAYPGLRLVKLGAPCVVPPPGCPKSGECPAWNISLAPGFWNESKAAVIGAVKALAESRKQRCDAAKLPCGSLVPQ